MAIKREKLVAVLGIQEVDESTKPIVRKRLPQKKIDAAVVETVNSQVGRKTKYDPKYAAIAKVLCSRGATDLDLAEAFDVSTQAIASWQTQFPGFGEAVLAGKAGIFDPKVERSLAMKAIGYSVDTEEVKITKDGDEIRYQVRKHYAPDTTACIFWLKNRQPERWRDVWKIEHDGKLELEKMTSAEVLKQILLDAAELGIPLTELAVSSGVVAPLPKTNGKGGNGSTKH